MAGAGIRRTPRRRHERAHGITRLAGEGRSRSKLARSGDLAWRATDARRSVPDALTEHYSLAILAPADGHGRAPTVGMLRGERAAGEAKL